ncbi:MAG: DNA polymerase III subunit alpha [Coriobacteriales bacterium]|jgi:DNA polymerase-3 subunit alpha|nr:DNA polymerase III subunit alpha [Coriobacteriales bacterium]
MAFVHLHNHSEYSMLDGAAKVSEMAKQAKAFGMEALALTDHGYMYGIPAFVDACKGVGIKPIVGCEVYFTPDDSLSREHKPALYHMILLAKNLTGYHNLMRIVSVAATDQYYYKPRTNLSLLQANHEGLICTSACIAGILPQLLMRSDFEQARLWATTFAELFGADDFYIELQNQGLHLTNEEFNKSVDLSDAGPIAGFDMMQNDLNHLLSDLAAELGLGTIATNDMHYLTRSDAPTQDAMLCIGTGKKLDDPGRMRFSCDQFYMKSEEEMRQALSDFPEACDNTVAVAAKCNVELEHDIILPALPLPEGETNDSMLRKAGEKGLAERYGADFDEKRPEVRKQFEHEYDVITQMGFAAYFLIVQEFVQWARTHGVGVGPGRGSAAGSIISYALGIVQVDPLANDLMFERFLSTERKEMPDIDVDFDYFGRSVVIEHLRDLYGSEKIANVITFGQMKAKQAVQDATRILDYPMGVGLGINKLVADGPGVSLKACLGVSDNAKKNKEQSDPDLIRLYQEDADTKRILDTAMQIEGFIRGEGIHASAVIICRDPVVDHVPTKRDTKGQSVITQYDGHYNADLGLLKMDFLGLRTLNIVMDACANVKRMYAQFAQERELTEDERGKLAVVSQLAEFSVPPERIFTDPEPYEMMRKGDTTGIFQIESGGMTSLAKRMQVDKYDDIVAMIALFRPGPLNSGMLDDFVERRRGRVPVTYYDERLKDILEPTYGTMVYQEQVMRISMTMSGFSAGESDRLRKAVAKKKIDLMTKTVQKWEDGHEETMKDHWLNGAVRNGYEREVAQRIWDDVEKFAEYAFNKSHSAAYAVIVMQCAWLKANFPVGFMAAVLTSYLGKSEKLAASISAVKQMGIDVLAPDINSSMRDFTPVGQNIRFGLAGIKGVGESAADAIIAEREAGGVFEHLHDFCYRVSNKICNKGSVMALIKAGAFDGSGYTRRQMYHFIEEGGLMERAAKQHQAKADGQMSLLGLFEEAGASTGGDTGLSEDVPAADGVEWERKTVLAFEKEVMGLYVSDHPLSPYADLLHRHSDYGLSIFAAEGKAEGEDNDEAAADLAEDSQGGSAGLLRNLEGKMIRLAGMLTDLQTKVTKKGDKMAVCKLEDTVGAVNLVVFPRTYKSAADLLVDDAIVEASGRIQLDQRGVQFIVQKLRAIDVEQSQPTWSALYLEVPATDFNVERSTALMSLLKQYPGTNPVTLQVRKSDGSSFKSELPLSVDAGDLMLRRRLAPLAQVA